MKDIRTIFQVYSALQEKVQVSFISLKDTENIQNHFHVFCDTHAKPMPDVS